MLSQCVESILLNLDAGYTEKIPQGKKVVFGACRITFRFRTCCIAVQLMKESLARNCMSPLIARPMYQPGFDARAISDS